MQDNIINNLIELEARRQNERICLIASENFASKAVRDVQGSILTNKYAEGYPGKRYYGGCEFVDQIEQEAINRAKKLFGAEYVNVQPHSGSQANQAAFLALLKPGDTILSLSLSSGGHLTHGSKVNMSGKWFNVVHYNLDPKTYLIDYDEVERCALENKPKLIIAGFSAYSRSIDFSVFRNIADKVGAYLLADIAHISGLIAAGFHQSPMDFADIVTSTTHKTLRGPRGGIMMSNNPDISKKLNSAVFPGIQGGPLMHVIGAKAVGFGENLQPEFKNYIKQVIKNSQACASTLMSKGYDVLTEGTDNHMVLIDLRSKGFTGKDAENALEQVGIICNKNMIPFDPAPPAITSGIRIGTPACTTQGFKEVDFAYVADMIAEVLDNLHKFEEVKDLVKSKVSSLTQKFLQQ